MQAPFRPGKFTARFGGTVLAAAALAAAACRRLRSARVAR
jgi:hypothetical protein